MTIMRGVLTAQFIYLFLFTEKKKVSLLCLFPISDIPQGVHI